jgi:hypothetical protein
MIAGTRVQQTFDKGNLVCGETTRLAAATWTEGAANCAVGENLR